MSFSRKLFLVALFWLLTTGLVVSVVILKLNAQLDIRSQLDVKEEIIKRLKQTDLILADLDTGIRGYLLTGEDVFLKPFSDAEGLYDNHIKESIDFLGGEKLLEAQVFQRLLDTKRNWMEVTAVPTMLARKKLTRKLIDQTAFEEIFKNAKGNEIVEKSRQISKAEVDRQQAEIKNILEKQNAANRQSQFFLLFVLPISMFLGFGGQLIIIRRVKTDIHSLFSEVDQVAQKVSFYSSKVSEHSQALTRASEIVVGAIHRASSATDELNAMTTQNVETVKQVVHISTDSSQKTEDGKNQINNLVKVMSHLEVNSEKISEIISIINDIAFQTNLLALNASVEAARVGELGKGFAVVAEAVRDLANRSAQSSNHISDLIQKTTESTKAGVVSVQQCAKVLAEISVGASELKTSILNIAEASNQQSLGISSIATDITELESTAQKNQEISGKLEHVFSELDESASQLKRSLDRMAKILGNKN